jgi:hypothetical protein
MYMYSYHGRAGWVDQHLAEGATMEVVFLHMRSLGMEWYGSLDANPKLELQHTRLICEHGSP